MAKVLSVGEEALLIKKEMEYRTFEKPASLWLKTGSKRFNKVIGSEAFGIPYGKMILICGDYSCGKTLVGLKIMGLAQEDGAEPGHVDLENSYDPEWAMKVASLDYGVQIAPGVYDKVALFRPEIGIFKKERAQPGKKAPPEIRMLAAEQLFDQAEQWLMRRFAKNPKGKFVMLVDSTTAAVPEEEMFAGIDGMNMRTKMSPAMFLNSVTKRWQSLAVDTNCLIILISQIRINPMQMFGNPERIPGGKGLYLFPHVIVQARRGDKGGNILDANGNAIGLRSSLTNLKNKSGQGSVERAKCGIQASFLKNDWKFSDIKPKKET
jgi:RecA/RadA recombinase